MAAGTLLEDCSEMRNILKHNLRRDGQADERTDTVALARVLAESYNHTARTDNSLHKRGPLSTDSTTCVRYQ